MIWSMPLVFNNKITNETVNRVLEYEPFYTYKDLYNHIDSFCKSFGWNIKITRYNVSFKLTGYTRNPIDVNNWDKYILNTDTIIITLYDPNKSSYGLFTRKGKKLLKVDQLDKIYSNIHSDKINQPLLIWKIDSSNRKLKLLDVIDNPIIYYNKLINRLISQYGDLF